MPQTNDQLSRPQLLGMICLGTCLWALIIGLIYAVAKWSLTGLIVAGTGGLGAVFLFFWLVWINKERR